MSLFQPQKQLPFGSADFSGGREGESVEVFDSAGVTIYCGTEHEIDLNRQGVHIVRVAGLTFKVMFK